MSILGNRIMFNLRSEDPQSWSTTHAIELADMSFGIPTLSFIDIDSSESPSSSNLQPGKSHTEATSIVSNEP
ncbi:hypothetical protein NLI96_g558 [Meripilus lineatus]|uniref:Uncharacterized protein n=1 Tax=Meripilus lineatus TaxID=2056292 RepID=A0AAD5YLV3_9APHY|nr:hypothetical protein NLI96_g558 [Physisporinus lineatus]